VSAEAVGPAAILLRVSVREEIEASRDRMWDLIRSYLEAYAARSPVRSVCVVGNAPLRPRQDRAERIDACDLVIRANSLVLDEPGGTGCVGRECHAVLLSRSTRMTRWVFQDYRKRAYLLMQAGFTNFRKVRDTAAHWPADLGAMPVPNAAVTKPLADRLLPDRQPLTLIPSTGTTGLFLAHEMFPSAELLATGFSFLDDRDQQEWRHHAGGATVVNSLHRLDLEGSLLQSWVDDGSMTLLD
jgi:hypothetical protein